MRAHCAVRVAKARAVLNLKPCKRVGVVARPGLRHIVEHTGVKSSAAARAALKQNIRVSRNNPFKHIIKAEHISVIKFTLMLAVKLGRADIAHISVIIPLDILDICALKNVAHALDDIIAYIFS